MVKTAISSHWHKKLKHESQSYKMIPYLNVDFLSFVNCHPLFLSCGSSSYEAKKASVQACLLSGRYYLERLTKHWTPSNSSGLCTLPSCSEPQAQHVGDIESFLLSCPSLALVRAGFDTYKRNFFCDYPDLEPIVSECLNISPPQFYLDCSTMAPVIFARQQFKDQYIFPIFKLTRQFFWILHCERLNLLNVVV